MWALALAAEMPLEPALERVRGCRRQDIYTGFNYVYTWQCCVTRAYYPCGVRGVDVGRGSLHTTTQDTHQVTVLGTDMLNELHSVSGGDEMIVLFVP